MLTLAASTRIYLHREPVDFRKAHDALAAIVRGELQDDPLNGSVYVFLNRARDRVKLLQWDGNGLWLHYKRLEKGTFRIPRANENGTARVTRAELSMLLEGIELKRGQLRRRFAESIEVQGRAGDEERGSEQPGDDRVRALLAQQRQQLAERDAELAKLREENELLRHNVEVYRRMAFGPSSEKRL
ncbi:MAG: IS66 family insertion sequence element accessory protein TnpB [Acidobacteriota bacterium]